MSGASQATEATPASAPARTASLERVRAALPLAGILVIGAVVRFFHVVLADFPLNDGGMFAAAIDDLDRNAFRLPHTLSYNHADIPFAYPPLTFYVAALLSRLTGAEPVSLLRWLPLLASVLTVPAVYLLGRSLLPRQPALLATLVFALLPRSFNWEVVGGGLTRSFGFLFAVLALHQGVRLMKSPARASAACFGCLAALAASSHLEMAVFVLIGSVVLLVKFGATRQRVLYCGLAAAIATGLTLVWLGPVLARYGLEPFLSAGSTANTFSIAVITIFGPSPYAEPWFPLLTALAVPGVFWAWRNGYRWILLWVVLSFLLDQRKAHTVTTVPVAFLAALGLSYVLLPLLNSKPDTPGSGEDNSRTQRLAIYALAGFALLAALAGRFAHNSPLRAVSADSRAAMEAIPAHTDTGSKFVVVTGQEQWALNAIAEWFPYLSGRESVITVQGYEWLGSDRFKEQRTLHREVQECADVGWTCLQQVMDESELQADFLFIARVRYQGDSDPEDACCAALRESAKQSPDLQLVFDLPGGTLLRFVSNQPR